MQERGRKKTRETGGRKKEKTTYRVRPWTLDASSDPLVLGLCSSGMIVGNVFPPFMGVPCEIDKGKAEAHHYVFCFIWCNDFNGDNGADKGCGYSSWSCWLCFSVLVLVEMSSEIAVVHSISVHHVNPLKVFDLKTLLWSNLKLNIEPNEAKNSSSTSSHNMTTGVRSSDDTKLG
ncbi:hypothetical protein ACSBR2_039013 [Camellia fascicularis]